MVLPNNNMAFTPSVKPLPQDSSTTGFKPSVAPLESQPVTPPTSPARTGIFSKLAEEHPTLYSAGRGIAEIVRQPARAMQQLGEAIGTIGQTPETKQKVHEFLQSGANFNPAGLGKPPETTEGAIGIGVQAAANLATPFAFTPARLGLQGAALAGGKAMEENKGALDVAIDAGIGGVTAYGLGKATSIAGKGLSKGMGAIAAELAPIVKKAFPFLTNIPKTEVNWAVKNAVTVVPKMKIVADAVRTGDPAAAESVLRKTLLTRAQSIYGGAKKVAQETYALGLQKVKEKFPNALGSEAGIQVKTFTPTLGKILNSEEAAAVSEIEKTITNHKNFSIDGLNALKQDLYKLGSQVEEGSPSARLVGQAIKNVNSELNRITNNEMAAVNEAFHSFKVAEKNVKPIWSYKATEDTSRNFVNSLENEAKGGSRDAMLELEKLANSNPENKGITGMLDEIRATRVAKMMNWEKAPAGSRMRDDFIRTLFTGGGAAIGSAFGPMGAAIGAGAGATAGIKLTSPRTLAPILFEAFEQTGKKLPEGVRKIIGEILENPKTQQILMRMFQSPAESSKIEGE